MESPSTNTARRISVLCSMSVYTPVVPPEWLGPLGEIFGLLGDSLAETIAGRMAGLLPDVEAQDKKVGYELEGIKQQVEGFAANGELLDNAIQTNRLLGPQFYDERIIQPMVRGLFPIADMIRDGERKMEVMHPKAKRWRNYLAALRVQLEQFCGGYGIESFEHAPDSPFNPKIMRPLQTTPTNEGKLDGLVAKSLQCGFRTQEHILRLETVNLYKVGSFEQSSNVA